MDAPMRPDEMRIVIRASDAPVNDARPIPASVFKKAFTTILGALKVADAELHAKRYRSEFFISHLAMGSNVFGVFEQRRSAEPSLSPSIDFFKQSAGAVYRSEYDKVRGITKVANSIIKVGEAITEEYPCEAHFNGESIPLDGFFSRQAERLKQNVFSTDTARHFAGNAVGSFDGRLGNIDYRGATWTGHLMLPGSGAQIECVFDKRQGEDTFNPFGNKRVSVTGRAIYTGDSQLPERIEVVSIEEIPPAPEAIDIRGSLTGKRYFVGWGRETENFQ